MMCHGDHEHGGESRRRKAPWLVVIGPMLALGLGAGVAAVYGVSWQTLGIVGLFAAHPLLHLAGMWRKPAAGARARQAAGHGKPDGHY